jgi:hypothetical protein
LSIKEGDPTMTDGERAILSEISNLRKEMNDGFRELRKDVKSAHVRIDEVEKDVATVDKHVAINKTKLGIFAVLLTGGSKALDFFIK